MNAFWFHDSIKSLLPTLGDRGEGNNQQTQQHVDQPTNKRLFWETNQERK